MHVVERACRLCVDVISYRICLLTLGNQMERHSVHLLGLE